MKLRKAFCALGLLFGVGMLFVLGCGDSSNVTKKKDKAYDIKGKVTAINADKDAVTLDHDDIPGLMKAMEMKFPVESAKVVEGIKAGDQVHGRLKVKAGGGYMITELHKE